MDLEDRYKLIFVRFVQFRWIFLHFLKVLLHLLWILLDNLTIFKLFGRFMEDLFGQTLQSDLAPRITSKPVPSHPQSPSGDDFGKIETTLRNIFLARIVACAGTPFPNSV